MRTLALTLAMVAALGALGSTSALADFRESLDTSTVPSDQLPRNLDKVGITQKLGDTVPLDLVFRDEAGRNVRLRDVLEGKPIVLTLAYFRCPSLCTLVLTGVVDGLRPSRLLMGKDYQAITVSIDPNEGPRLALAKKRSYLARYARLPIRDEEQGWRFLTGTEPAIKRLADAVGFRYSYDTASGQYSHASVAMVLTPEGRLSQYLFGIHFEPAALESAITKASSSGIGSPLQQLILYCFHYDASTGKWSVRIMRTLRVLGVLTVFFLAGAFAFLLRKERAA